MNIHRISGFSYDNIGGNPAGVLICDVMPNEEQMLAIAKEVNYSETAFLQVLDDNKFRIRFFSPEMEIDFCGHATIASGDRISKEFGYGEYELVLNNGSININIEEKNNTAFTSIKSMQTKTEAVDEDIIDSFIELFNFTKQDLATGFPIKKSYSGNYHLIVFVRDKKILENMEYDFEKAKDLCRAHDITTISVLYKENDETIHSRNAFAYGGVYEDPATGSAAIALGEYLRHTNIKASGSFTILQGFDMQVPCKLYVSYDEIQSSPVSVSGESRIIEEGK